MHPTLVAAALLAATTCSSFSLDWPRYRGANYDGISVEKNWLGNWPGGQPRQLWKAAVGTGFSSLSIANGRLYTIGNSGKQDTVYCLDAASGKEIWKHTYAQELDPKYYEGGPGATPTVDGSHVYTFARHGTVHCLDAATGHVVWTRDIHKEFGCEIPDWGFNGSVHIENDLAILNAGIAGLALNKATGEKVWLSGKEAAGYGTPVPLTTAGKRAIALFTAKYVVAVDPRTGGEYWRHPWKTKYDVNAADPAISGNQMYVSSGYETGGAVIDFTDNKPNQVWFNKEIRAQTASPIVVGNYVYGIDGSGGDKNSHLKCLDLKTGTVVWISPAATTGSLTVADGRIIWLTGGGEVIVVEAKPDGYKELARAQVSGGKHWSAPVLSNGRLYLRSAKGDLVCVDVKGNPPTI